MWLLSRVQRLAGPAGGHGPFVPVGGTNRAGGSGAGGGDCRSKKRSAFHRATLRYLEKEYRECVARGEEPPFDLEDLLWRYGSSPPNPDVPAPPSSTLLRQQEIRQSILCSHVRTVENLCVVVRIFKLHVEYSFVKFCNGLSTPFN